MPWPKGRKHSPETLLKMSLTRGDYGIDWSGLEPTLREMVRKGDSLKVIGKRLGVHPTSTKNRIVKMGLANEHMKARRARREPCGRLPQYS